MPVPQMFPHPPSDRHLGCFKVLVITNKMAMNIHANVVGHMLSFLRVKWLDHMVGVCLIKKLPSCFPKWLHHFPPPPAAYENFRFSPYLSGLGVVSVFNFSHSTRCIVISHGGFNLYFPNRWCWKLFHVIICHVYLIWSLCWNILLLFYYTFSFIEFWEFFIDSG